MLRSMKDEHNPKASSTKVQIVQAATQLFHKNGAHWVSFQQIADQVKISQPALYRHFEDKDDLMRACILYAAQSGREIIDRHVSLENKTLDQMRAYMQGNLLWLYGQPQQASLILSMYYFALNNQPIRDLMLQIENQSVGRLSHYLIKGLQENLWHIKKSRIKETAREIHDLMLGEMIKAAHWPDEIKLDKRTQFLWQAVSKLLIISKDERRH
jgi:TetR/AcrR family fatty acid metabolism transcriptional regulator